MNTFSPFYRYPFVLMCALVLVFMHLTYLLFEAAPDAWAARFQGSTPLQSIPGHLVPLVETAPPLGPTAADTLLHLSIGLTLRFPQALNALLAAQEDPTSGLYHQYLMPQAFRDLFGPELETVNKVVAFLRAGGLHIDAVAPNRLLITASGTVDKVEQIFHTMLQNYRVHGRLVYAPSVDPSVPEPFASSIQTIGGLEDVAIYQPHLRQHEQLSQIVPRLQGYTPDELRTAYNIKPLLQAGADGRAQTLALFELDGYYPDDIATYRTHFHLGPGLYSTVLVGDATNTPGPESREVAVDIEKVAAIAPRARQMIYIGNNTVAGVNETYNRIVTDSAARVISTSWGVCELASGEAEIRELDTIFRQGAAQGQSFFAASGDLGAYDCQNGELAVDVPADDPFVVGVGGTTLYTGDHGEYIRETAWHTPDTPVSYGGGGGISSSFPRPAYQQGLVFVPPHRLVPDVSGNADPYFGFEAYFTNSEPVPSGWHRIGGTSLAAPLWAAIAVDVNQYLADHHCLPLGHINALLYRLAQTKQPFVAFHDVTEGNNLHYDAGSGYDLATGLGTPDAWNLARDVAANCAQALPGGTADSVRAAEHK